MKSVEELLIGPKTADKSPFVIISGPCAIESLDTCLRVGEKVKELCEKHGFFYVFKASYDKANRLSVDSFRGPGVEKGLEILSEVKKQLDVPVLSDVSLIEDLAPAAEVLDIIQIPAYLVHYKELLVQAAKTGKVLNIKKPQDYSYQMMTEAVQTLKDAGCDRFFLTERGTSFGYGSLINDMSILSKMREHAGVLYDASHSAMKPGGMGKSSGGTREHMMDMIRASVAMGINGLFLESHPDPNVAETDKKTQIPLHRMDAVLDQVAKIKQVTDQLNIYESIDI